MLLGDSSFAALELLAALVRHDLIGVTRLRLDAALYAPAPPRTPATTGRPRKTRARRPTLARGLADPATVWHPVSITGWYGRRSMPRGPGPWPQRRALERPLGAATLLAGRRRRRLQRLLQAVRLAWAGLLLLGFGRHRTSFGVAVWRGTAPPCRFRRRAPRSYLLAIVGGNDGPARRAINSGFGRRSTDWPEAASSVYRTLPERRFGRSRRKPPFRPPGSHKEACPVILRPSS
ncbi:MAG: hypothetical protein JO162_12650 [Alphaproteobacteria bacterium]|nr:hypothetical protein [Alphaproteobacteria bacterium]